MNGYNLCDTLCSDAQSVVGLAESIKHCKLGIYLAETLVVDNQQRVYVFRHLFDAIQGLIYLLRTLKTEWNRNDSDSEYAQFFRYLSNHRGCSRSRSTTHSGRDKRHSGTVTQHISDVIKAFFGCLSCLFGFVSGPKSFLTELQVHGHGRIIESLVVCIAKHESYVVNALSIHMVDGITATATHADDFNDAVFFLRISEIHDAGSVIVIFHNFN